MTGAARAFVVGAGLVAALAAPARAHRLNVEARVEAGRVRVEVYFSDGATPAGAEVVVTRDGVEVARGATDAAGAWSFAPPGAGRYVVAVTEPGLHRGAAEVVVGQADLAAPAPLASATRPASSERPTSSAPASEPPAPRGGVDWAGTAAGVLLILVLAAGLSAWQRRRPA